MLPVHAAPHWANWGAGHVPPQGSWRSEQDQVFPTQRHWRATHSPLKAQFAPAGEHGVPAMLKGQVSGPPPAEVPPSIVLMGPGPGPGPG